MGSLVYHKNRIALQCGHHTCTEATSEFVRCLEALGTPQALGVM